MSELSKNNRVVVTHGDYRGQHGKVLDDITGILNLQRQYQIKLDAGATVKLGGSSLQQENLTQSEVKAEVANLKRQISEVASQLPQQMGSELPNHLDFLHEALASRNQPKFSSEYSYITNELSRALNAKSVTQQWSETFNIGLEKLKHNMDSR